VLVWPVRAGAPGDLPGTAVPEETPLIRPRTLRIKAFFPGSLSDAVRVKELWWLNVWRDG